MNARFSAAELFSAEAGYEALNAIPTLWQAAGVTLAFTALARWMRGVSRSGALAGALVCFLIYLGAGPGAFVALVVLFALTWTTTRLRYERKQVLGTAEKRDGRTASQILANLGTAAGAAALFAITRKFAFLAAVGAALAEAAADTVSSEVGQASSTQARLITTWEKIPAGTDGGVSLAGTLAGIAAACLVSAVFVSASPVAWRSLWVLAVAAVFGMVGDSFLGAWLERKHVLNNDTVNFLSTLIAAGIAGLLA